MTPRSSTRNPHAFTLIEMVVSLAITAIVMLACGSVMVLAARAAENGLGPQSQVGEALQARLAADQIVSDLEVATDIKEQTLTAITILVPDRDGDGAAEVIRYAWDGASGSALNRTYNGATSVLASNVSRFSLEHVLKVAVAGSPVSGVTRVLSANLADPGLLLSQYSLTSTAWVAQYFEPALPKGTSSWSLDGVKLYLKRNGANTGLIDVSLHAADALGRPTGAALGSGSVDVAGVPLVPDWVDVRITGATNLSPSAGVVLVVGTSAVAPAYIYYNTPTLDLTMKFATSGNGGESWSLPLSTSALEFTIYGGYK